MASHDLAYFRSIPWCASLVDDPTYAITPTSSREPKESTEDALLAETLKTDRTIAACLSLYKKPATLNARIEEVVTLFALGPGLNGYPHVCHGGMVATIMDEAMGLLLTVNKDREEEVARTTGSSTERPASFTAELTIQYPKPVTTSQIVCVKASFSRTEGRKFWMQGTIEDESGTVLARGHSMFVQKRRERL